MRRFTVPIGIILIVMLPAWVSASEFELPDPTYGTRPGANIQRWIRLAVVGPSNSSFPIVYISQKHFKQAGFPEMRSVLPGEEYNIVSRFVRRNQCSKILGNSPEWGTFEVAEYANGRDQVLCIMPPAAACRYISNIVGLKGVVWTKEKVLPFYDLAQSLKCKS